MKRHVVSNLQLREISSVDRPAQVGAVSVLMKRREAPAFTLAKATFQEALEGQVMASRVNDAFYNSFNGLWERNDAFRTALTDELAAGGDGAVASAAYVQSVESLVQHAVEAARTAGTDADAAVLTKAFTQAATDWLEKQENTMTIKTKADLTAAIEKAQAAGDKVTVADVTAIHKAATELKADDLLPASGVLAKVAAPTLDDATSIAVTRMVKRDALSAELRKHYDGLADDAARDAFLAKSAADQQVDLAKAGGDDPVVYTTLDGVDIRKSADPALLAMAKGRDDDKRELAKALAAGEDAVLEKRATDDLGNIGGELLGKKALLKAVDGIADASTKDAALAVLKAANTAGKGAFVRKGANGENTETVTGEDGRELTASEARLDELAKVHATEHKVTFEKAYAEVIQTTEGAALYKRFVKGDE